MPLAFGRFWLALVCGILGSASPGVSFGAEVVPADAPRPGYRLRYQFRPNQFVHYEVVQTMSIETRKGEAAESTVNESRAHKHFRVVSVDSDGAGTLEAVIDRVELTAQFGDNPPIVYDSTSPPPPPQFADVDKTIGKPIVRVKVAPTGKLLSVVRTLSKDLQEGVTADTGDAAPDTDRSKNFLVVFPDKPVHVGETWTDKLQISVNVSKQLRQPVTLRRRYRLESVANGSATISLDTSVLTPVNDPHVRAELIQRTPKGTIVFDLNRGLLVSRTLSVDKTELGVFGGGSLMRAVSERTERLVPQEKSAAASHRTALGRTNHAE